MARLCRCAVSQFLPSGEQFLEDKAILRDRHCREEKCTEIADGKMDVAAVFEPAPGIDSAGLGSVKLGLVICHVTEHNRD